MDGPRWARLQQLFREALSRPAPARDAFLAEVAADDAELADALRRLLAQDAADDATVRNAIGQAAARLVGTRQASRIGQRLGPWRVVAHLADGGMGAVYRGERDDGQYAQQVAIKLLNPAFASDDAKARLEVERRILARLEHPAIARLLDGGRTDDGVPYLVMEYVDGEPIDAWCEHRSLGTAARLRLFVQVCRAVDHAHRNLVVHRDLKPANILVDTEGRPRLLDFGIAKLVDGAPGVTRTGERVLTPSHASPEQITGGAVTTATDVYALGVLLYDLLTGRAPYGGPGTPPAALARQIVETLPPRPSAAVTEGHSSRRLSAARARGERLTPQRLAQELSGDLDNIVLMALRKEPERRYATVADLADDIERSLAHLPVRARPDTLGYRGAKFLRRHPLAVPVSALAAAMALGGAGAFTWQLARERDRAVAAETSTRRTAEVVASLLESTTAEQGGSAEVSVRDMLERSRRRIESELADEPEVAARLRHVLGRAYYSWYDYEAALAQQQAALATLRQLHPEPNVDVARVYTSLGNVTHGLGRLDESLDWARRAEAEWRVVGTPVQRAVAIGDVGAALNSLRRLEEARELLERAVRELRAAVPGDHFELAYYLQYRAYNRYRAGDLEAALAGYQEALAMYRRLGTRLPQVVDLQETMAALLDDLGHIEEAEQLSRGLLPLVVELYGGDGGGSAVGLHNRLAAIALSRGQFEEALQQADLAREIAVRNLGPRHRYEASQWLQRASALMGQGRLDEAEAAIREAEAVRRTAVTADSPDHATTAAAHARLALARGRPAEAEARLQPWRDRRVPTQRAQVDLEWHLALAIALQGRRDEARALAATALQRLPSSHWHRQAMAVLHDLPPFTARPTAEALDQARVVQAALRSRLGPDALPVAELAAAIKAAGGR
ncbi:MAG: serine/threonine protein kinase [Burkholderiaceae bacterium]|nr:serine/threonine protein kinase [Burkholderiaceae bacterium]